MGKYNVEFTKQGRADLQSIKRSGNLPTIHKVQQMLRELTTNPYEGTGKPEKLKHNYSVYWSRRINKKDRLVYKVEEEIVTVFVVSALGHYEER